ncbi:MAG: protein arginine kinase, partial [Syntrophaceticus sp.]
MSIKNALNNPYTKWMEGKGPYASIVISSRVRLARNLNGYNFPHRLEEKSSREVMGLVQDVLTSKEVAERVGGIDFASLEDLSPLDRMIFVEKHLISPQFAEGEGAGRGLGLSEDEAVSVMVNEEDHLRLQVLFPALQLQEAWELASLVDDLLESKLDYAFDEQYGYLTCCPTNVGTGLRASVMMHLPAIAMNNQAKKLFMDLSKLGFVVRGLYGEGTQAKGDIFQISNQITLGLSEEEIIGNLTSVSRQIIEQEQWARDEMRKNSLAQLEDMVFRSYGTLTNAYVISSEEAMDHLSNVRLGLDMGLIRDVELRKLNELLVKIRPVFLQKLASKEIDAFNRDFKRAELIRNT